MATEAAPKRPSAFWNGRSRGPAGTKHENLVASPTLSRRCRLTPRHYQGPRTALGSDFGRVALYFETAGHTLRFKVMVSWSLIAVVGLLVWIGVTLLVDTWIRRQSHPDLFDRLVPFQPGLAEDAEDWLHRQG